jgi:cobalt-zinc-cadmium efflux system outer membrane protein
VVASNEADLIRLAMAHSPRMAEARAAREASRGERWQSSLWPNPVASAESEEIPAGEDPKRGTWALGIEQTLPMSPRRYLAVSAAKEEERAADHSVEAAAREVTAQVREARLDLLFQREAAGIRRTALETALAARDAVAARAEVGAGAAAETLRAGVQVSRAVLALRDAEAALIAAEGTLRAVLGVSALDAGAISGSLPAELPALNAEEAVRCFTSESPAVRAADAAAVAARLRARSERWSLLPEPSVRAAWGRDGATDEDLWQAGVALEIPLFDRRQGAALVARSVAATRAAESQAREASGVADLRALSARYETWRQESRRLASETVPAARLYAERTREGYDEGRLDLLAMLDAQNTLAEAEELALETRRAAAVALVRIESLAGPSCTSAWIEGDER